MRWLGLVVLLIGVRAAADTSLTVRGDRAWTPTGVRMKKGQQLAVTARGTVTSGAVAVSPDGAKGTEAFHDIEAHYPLTSAPPYALIARIDKDPPVLVGASMVITATHDGELLLGINDDQVADNQGQWMVSIATPGAKPPPTKTAQPAGPAGAGTWIKGTSRPAKTGGNTSEPHGEWQCLYAEDRMINGDCRHCPAPAVWDSTGTCAVPPGPVIAPPPDWQERLRKATEAEKARKRKYGY